MGDPADAGTRLQRAPQGRGGRPPLRVEDEALGRQRQGESPVRIRLSFESYKVWPKVQHLFEHETKAGEWADGVEIVTSFGNAIVVSIPLEMEVTIREILDGERVPYWIT
jgi:hypothetical protein